MEGQAGPGIESQPEPAQENPEIEQIVALQSYNIAKDLDEDELTKIGMECKQGFDLDENSRKDWLAESDEWLRLAKQIREQKSFPWTDASNVKYPLLSTAALQFNARAYPTLVPGDGKIVKTRIYGVDRDGQKVKKGERVSRYMSWQLTSDMCYWEEDMDKLLMMLPICGNVFKKTFYNPIEERVDSILIFAENLVVDYWCNSLEYAPRISEIIAMTQQEIKERQLKGIFLDIELPSPTAEKDTSKVDWTTPYKIIEQHTWLDLDEDGLREPYIVTFEHRSGKILRISARYRPENIKLDKDNKKIASFEADCYYTKFSFIPNPDGSFYDLGFGHLLGPINEAANTLINQLIDSGTLHNLQAGFVGKGLRLRMGQQPLQPGEFRAVNAIGDDLRKQIVLLPTKEPSNVLFNLLGMLITSGKELASVAEIFVGKMPGQNTPATTTMATIEQGMKVFTAIYKRVYRSLEKEFKKIFDLNHYYMDRQTYVNVLDDYVSPEDFDKDLYDVCPSADPTATTQAEKLMKAQALMELLGTGLLDPQKVIMRVLEAQEQPNWEELIPGLAETGQPQPPQEQPDPKLMAIEAKIQADQNKAALEERAIQQKMAFEAMSDEAKLRMMEEKHAMNLQAQALKARLQAESQQAMSDIFAVQGQQKMIQSAMEHAQKLKQEKEKSQEKSSPSGKPARRRRK